MEGPVEYRAELMRTSTTAYLLQVFPRLLYVAPSYQLAFKVQTLNANWYEGGVNSKDVIVTRP